MSESEIDDNVQRVHYEIWERQDLFSNVSTGFDFDAGAITADAVLAESVRQRATWRNADELLAEIFPDTVSVPIVLRLASWLEDSDYDIARGGIPLSSCTAGFTVHYISVSNLPKGITTAAHCPDDLKLSGDRELTFESEHRGSKGDVQWHSRPGTNFRPRFRWKVGEFRKIIDTGEPVKSQKLCKFGKATKRTCDNVRQLNVCKNSDCSRAWMMNRKAAPGDSGSPWYFGRIDMGYIRDRVRKTA